LRLSVNQDGTFYFPEVLSLRKYVQEPKTDYSVTPWRIQG
jgi:hypothetical protein